MIILLDKFKIESRGFGVLKDYNSWRIAILGYDNETNSIEGINQLGRHFETDEVFVLIKGTAYMITAGNVDVPSNLALEQLDDGHIYVVKEKQWHAAILEPESILLIIENQNTNDDNSENYMFNFRDKIKVKNMLNEIYTKKIIC